jgi:hypothetical protein
MEGAATDLSLSRKDTNPVSKQLTLVLEHSPETFIRTSFQPQPIDVTFIEARLFVNAYNS